MKLLLCFLFCTGSIICYAQKIKENELDKFTGYRRINTSYVRLSLGFFKVMSAKLRTVDTTIFLELKGNIGLGTIGSKDELIFLFDDKSTLTIFPTGIQSYEGVGTEAHYEQEYNINKEQLNSLALKNVVSVRRYFNNNYVDQDIKKTNSQKLVQLAKVLLVELAKNK